MDASKAAEKASSTPPEAQANPPEQPMALRNLRSTRKRRSAGLAALLAVAVAIPTGLHLNATLSQDGSPQAKPNTARKAPVTTDEAVREARRTGKDIEVPHQRTATSTTWARPDGLLRTRTYGDTIRAKVGGEWKPIDTTLERVSGGYAPKAVNDPLLFSHGTTADKSASRASRALARPALLQNSPSEAAGTWSELVRFTTDGHDIVVSWPGPLPAPVIDGPRALYEEVRPGIDLLLTARDSGFSHVLIVKNREAASDPVLNGLDYRLTSPTLTFTFDAKTRVVSARDNSGQEVAAAPSPYMWDSAGPVKETIGEAAPSPEAAVEDTSLTEDGLAGPQPGTHDAPLGATFNQDTGVLAITVADKLLADADTVYPVFIDPSLKGRKQNWTLLYEKYRTSSFYNGQNFNDGSNDARVGYESDSGGLSRSIFTFEYPSALRGATVKTATFRALQTYAWGCASRQYNLYLTGAISSTTTWDTQPAWIRQLSSQTNGHGYRSDTCPDKWIAMDIRSAAQEASNGKWASLPLGLRAAHEADASYWKKFLANGESAPYIEMVYNRPPNEPTASAMKMSPGVTCDPNAGYVPSVGRSDLTFIVTGSDPDGATNLKYINLYVWPTNDPDHPVVNQNLTPDSYGTAKNTPYPWSMFTNGTTYSWAARTIDDDGATSLWGPAGTTKPCKFKVDNTAPTSPNATSTAFPQPGPEYDVWSTKRYGEVTGTFTFTPGGTGEGVAKYQYSFNTAFDQTVTATADGSAVTPVLRPPHAGPNVLYVRAVDASGNISSPFQYVFYVSPPKVLDHPGDVTGDGIPDLYSVNEDGVLELYAKSPGKDRFHRWLMAAAYTIGENGKAAQVPDGYWTNALITHNGDWLPGDGIQDLVARMADGKLYTYEADGYGGFDVNKRREVILPAGAPAPASLRQIVAVGDVTGDGRPDMLALAGGNLWAFTGYTGATFTMATHLTGEDWTDRDLVQLGDLGADSALDLVFRANTAGQLQLRYGKNAAAGGLDLASIGTKTASAGQLDTYGASGWSRTAAPIVTGFQDVTSDGNPEVVVLLANGDVRVNPGHASGLVATTPFYLVRSTVGTTWSGYSAIG
ncbi:DNRLRE domain-containing protein [Streptomyces lavendulocolor]|uniref:DNRLRE domain-containing protein n=1 Tax=Streptomyces lavendulocolor TaxID=67316 RepID=UPI003C2D4F11